ncbi:MAG TPA: exopolysaccharide biosynthesis polyprenyl glycosylphosphotransferase [Solirubrobacterales bacterium]|nr:exopolysaccharide biosynthesis polyprenyl glycosylphosphotransferase [Solirubrobacterales bacterium]
MTSEPIQQTGLARKEASRQTSFGRELGEIDSAYAKVFPIRGGRAARARGAILRRLLAISDWISLIAGTALSYLLIASVEPSSIAWSAAFGPAWILVMKLHGLYDQDHRRIRHSTLDELPTLFSATVIGTVMVGVLIRVTPAPYVKGTALGVLAVTAFVIGASLRGLTRQIWHARRPPEKSAVVGSGAAMRRLSRRIETHPEVHLSLVGYFGDERTSDLDAEVNGANGHMSCLGPRSELIPVAEQRGLEHILVAEESISTAELRRLIGDCKRFGLSLTLVAPNAELLGPGIQLNRLGELPLLDFAFSDPSRSTMALKRGIDIVASAGLLLLLAPLLLVVAVAIKLDSRGPVLFKQVRVGKGGRRFTMLKFRTMVHGADERIGEVVDTQTLDEPSFKVPNDPRHTWIGRRLRRLSLDETPQLLNVLRGEMSLVGPRPEEEAVVVLYDDRQRLRLTVKPGLTGPMQVYGRGDLTFEERLALERAYIDNLSIAQDVAVLLRTPRAVIGGSGAY